MFTLKSLGSIAIQAGRSKLLTFTPCQSAISVEPSLPVLASALLQAPAVFDTQVRFRRSCIRDLKKDYNWKRERPFGPHRHQPPNRRSHRASENYHHIIHYPKDGEYTIKKLDGKYFLHRLSIDLTLSLSRHQLPNWEAATPSLAGRS